MRTTEDATAGCEPRRGRYYSSVIDRRTTRCRGVSGIYRICLAVCTAVGLTLVPAASGAQPPGATPAVAPPVAPPAAGPATTLPFFPLRVRWAADLDGPPAAPAVTDGTRVFVPLSTGTLVAVDAETGATRWKAEVSTALRPAADSGHVYVVAGDALQALDAGSGAAAWRVPLPAPVSAPLVARAGWVLAALETGEIVALRGADGTEVWRRHVGVPVVAPAAIDGDRLYLPGADGLVRAFTVSTGAPLWSRALGGSIVSVAPLGARLYVGSTDNHFYCLDDRDGRVRWRWRAGADPVGTPIADDERVYFSALDTVLRALDRGHGAQRWRQPLPWRPRTGPIRVGNTIVAAGIALDLRGYALDTGREIGEFALTENRLEVLEGAPVLVARTTLPGDFLVAAIADGRLIALEHVFGLPPVPLTTIPGERVALTPPPS